MRSMQYTDQQIDRELTLRATLFGILFGILFGSANAYLGLSVGLTISTSIPAAVISIAFFKGLKKFLGESSVLEYNIAQTVGSASSSLASGVIFTIPALFMWGFSPGFFQLGFLAMFGGLLGILFMIPLRKYLIVQEHKNLPYPEGTACAHVLIAAEKGGQKARNILWGITFSAIFKILSGFFKLWKEKVFLSLPGLKKAVIGIKISPALLGVGFILGYRISAIMVAGGLLSWVILIPLIAHFGAGVASPILPETVKPITAMSPEEIWYKYIRFIGAGAVACAGIITAIKSIPVMFSSFKAGLAGFCDKTTMLKNSREEKDLPLKFVLQGVVLIIMILTLVPHILGVETTFIIRLISSICIAIFAFIFVTVSSRIVGLVGVTSNPTSGMTIVTLIGTSLVFYFLGWTDNFGKATVLTIGTVVCVAASIAGDTSQDLKTGYLVRATPYRQQIGELIGAISSAFFIIASVWILGKVYGFGTIEVPAPQATLMKTVIEGVLSANLPWILILFGIALAIIAEILSIPSLPFAVGVYLPLSTMTPIFLGGIIRKTLEKTYSSEKSRKEGIERGILLGSGYVAGEGIVGVLIAAYAFILKSKPQGIGLSLSPVLENIISILALILIMGYLIYRVRLKKTSDEI